MAGETGWRSTSGSRTRWRRPDRSVRGRALLEHEVALDREGAPAVGQIEELDQVRIDVQLVAVATQPAGDREAQSLALVGHSEGRVEAAADEPTTAGWAAILSGCHWMLDPCRGTTTCRPSEIDARPAAGAGV